MDALQINAELFRALSEIADDETLMAKALRYLKRLAARKEDKTLMAKDDFFARVDRALESADKGEVYTMLPDESLDDFLNRI